MDWKSVGRVVAKAAPVLGGLLGGPVGAAAGKIAADVLGTDPEPDKVIEAIKADPQALAKLKEAELEYKERLAELEHEEAIAKIEQEKHELDTHAADRRDAREMAELRMKQGKNDTRANLMILGDVVGLVACLLILIFVDGLTGEVRGILSMIASYFGLGLRDAHQFEFGSSRGSKDKDLQMMEKLKGFTKR